MLTKTFDSSPAEWSFDGQWESTGVGNCVYLNQSDWSFVFTNSSPFVFLHLSQIKSDLKKRVNEDPDYNSQRFPNTHKAFSEDSWSHCSFFFFLHNYSKFRQINHHSQEIEELDSSVKGADAYLHSVCNSHWWLFIVNTSPWTWCLAIHVLSS